jgi:hypothetical protein
LRSTGPMKTNPKFPRAPRPAYGHSKDRRDDLRQVLLSLGVSRDGGIPLRLGVRDGNRSDSVETPGRLKSVWPFGGEIGADPSRGTPTLVWPKRHAGGGGQIQRRAWRTGALRFVVVHSSQLAQQQTQAYTGAQGKGSRSASWPRRAGTGPGVGVPA